MLDVRALRRMRGRHRMRLRHSGGLSMAVTFRLSFAACGAAAAIAFPLAAQALTVGAYHVLPLPGYYAKTGHLPPGGGDGPVYYYGGSVFSNVKLVSVIWNGDVLQNTKDQIPLLSAALVNSTYIDQMAEYGTLHQKAVNGHKGT